MNRMVFVTVAAACASQQTPLPEPRFEPWFVRMMATDTVYAGDPVSGGFEWTCPVPYSDDPHGDSALRSCRRLAADVRSTCKGIRCSPGGSVNLGHAPNTIGQTDGVVPEEPGQLEVTYDLVRPKDIAASKTERYTVLPKPEIRIVCTAREPKAKRFEPCFDVIEMGSEVRVALEVRFAPGTETTINTKPVPMSKPQPGTTDEQCDVTKRDDWHVAGCEFVAVRSLWIQWSFANVARSQSINVVGG